MASGTLISVGLLVIVWRHEREVRALKRAAVASTTA